MSEMLNAALSYAKRGWSVFPAQGIVDGKCTCGVDQCGSPGKHPCTKNGVKDASANPQVIHNWWRMYPNANVAIATGEPSGLFVADYDGAEGVELSEAFSSELTPRVITGGGGRHFFFAMPDVPVGNRAHVVPHMDVRSTGGYVIAPPSKHASGGVYTFAPGFSPDDTDPAPVPPEIMHLLSVQKNPVVDAEIIGAGFTDKDADEKFVKRATSYASHVPGAVSGEGGHGQTFMLALKLVHGFGLSRKQAIRILVEYNKRCKPPWTTEELKHKLEDAVEKARDPKALGESIRGGEIVLTAGKPWIDKLQTTNSKDGLVPIKLFTNGVIFIENDNPPPGLPKKDAFSGKTMVGVGDSLRAITNFDILEYKAFFESNERKLYIGKDLTVEAIDYVAGKNEYHPVRDYLASLEWDGTPRIEEWLIRHAGAKDDTYVRAVSKKWLIGAVARVMRAGCRMDTMLVLEGAQGTRKSTLVDVLGRPWSVGLTGATLHSEAALEQIQGRWIVEMSELDGLRRSEVESVKDFLSRTNDNFRPKYGRVSEDHLRQCVFFGTTNACAYLIDETGNRRFWPVAATKIIDTEAIAAERDQMWSEAVAEYYKGTPWHLTDEEDALARMEQFDRMPQDSWQEVVGQYLDAVLLEATLMPSEISVGTGEIMKTALEIDPAHQTPADQKRVGSIMKRLGWQRKQIRYKDKRSWRYVPPEVTA